VWWWDELGDAYSEVGNDTAAHLAFQVVLDEARSSGGADAYVLANAAWATYRLGNHAGAVGFAQRAVSIQPMDPIIRLALGTMLQVTGRALAAVSEVEAAAAMVKDLPDPRRSAAILEDAIYDQKLLGADLDHQDAEQGQALSILRDTAERLRHPTPAVATSRTEA
jgi:hypothetical protein